MKRNNDGTFGGGVEPETDTYRDLYHDFSDWVTTTQESEHVVAENVGRKSRTTKRLLSGVRVWLVWCEDNDIHPLEVEEQDVRAFIREHKSEWTDTTMHRKFSTVSKYYHHLRKDSQIEENYEEANPTKDINIREDYQIKPTAHYRKILALEGRKDQMVLPPEDIELLLENVPGKNEDTRAMCRLIIRLLWDTGMRCDELSRVKLENIDWDNREINIRSSKLNPEDHEDLFRRNVWWTPETDEIMYRWIDTYRSSKSGYADESPYLIPTNQSEQIGSGTISRKVKQAGHRAGINEPLYRDADGNVKQWAITGHRLRHSRITYLANEAKMNLNSLRIMAGHAQFDTTLDYIQDDKEVVRRDFRRATE